MIIDLQSRRQLKLSVAGAAPAKVIQQAPLVIEYLHDPPLPIDHVQVAFGIESNPLRPEDPSRAIANLADRVFELAAAVQHLHAEIHGVDHHQVLPVQPQLGRKIKFPVPRPRLPDDLQHAALHVHHVNLVAQRVGYIDPSGRRVHRDARRPLEISLAAFQAPDHPPVFSVRVKHKNLPRLRVRHINIVLRIHGHALRRDHRILPRITPRQKFIFLRLKIEYVNPHRRRVAHNDPSPRIRHHAVRTDQIMKIRLSRDHVHHPRPKTSLRLDFPLQAEALLPRQFSAAIHQQIRRRQRPQRLLRALRRSPRYAYAHPQERGGDEHPCARTRASPPPCVQRSDCRLPGHSTLSCIGIRF